MIWPVASTRISARPDNFIAKEIDPGYFGEIQGIKVGQVFKNRDELSKSGIHKPSMAGIWGSQDTGAYSIVLSGGYEDDIDQFDYILYTGQGGQDSPGGKQIKDQEFSRGNTKKYWKWKR